MCPRRVETTSYHWSRNSGFLFDSVGRHRRRDELAAFGVTRCKRELQEDHMAEDARGASPSGELEFVPPLRAQAPEEVTADAEADAVLFEAVERPSSASLRFTNTSSDARPYHSESPIGRLALSRYRSRRIVGLTPSMRRSSSRMRCTNRKRPRSKAWCTDCHGRCSLRRSNEWR